MKNKKWIVAAALVVFLIALGVTLYPLLSDWYVTRHESVLRTEYLEHVEQLDDGTLAEEWDAAAKYNEMIMPGAHDEGAFSSEALLAASEGYEELLNISGNGIMGYVEIPKIGLTLPIWHGSEADTLENGVGHLQGSSLPVGGDSTHSVLTAHSGMAGRKMFSDLDQLNVGDVFYLQVLDETLAYQVDQVRTVLPYETEELQILSGKDLCTLVTCTPFGVNTHRLLIRGTRIPYEEATAIEAETVSGNEPSASTWRQQYVKSVLISIAIALLPLFVILLVLITRRKRRKKQCGEKS